MADHAKTRSLGRVQFGQNRIKPGVLARIDCPRYLRFIESMLTVLVEVSCKCLANPHKPPNQPLSVSIPTFDRLLQPSVPSRQYFGL